MEDECLDPIQECVNARAERTKTHERMQSRHSFALTQLAACGTNPSAVLKTYSMRNGIIIGRFEEAPSAQPGPAQPQKTTPQFSSAYSQPPDWFAYHASCHCDWSEKRELMQNAPCFCIAPLLLLLLLFWQWQWQTTTACLMLIHASRSPHNLFSVRGLQQQHLHHQLPTARYFPNWILLALTSILATTWYNPSFFIHSC